MTEILLVLAATAAVFAIFLLVFFIREKGGKEPVDLRPCAHCHCERSTEARRLSLALLKQRGSGSEPKNQPPQE